MHGGGEVASTRATEPTPIARRSGFKHQHNAMLVVPSTAGGLKSLLIDLISALLHWHIFLIAVIASKRIVAPSQTKRVEQPLETNQGPNFLPVKFSTLMRYRRHDMQKTIVAST